MSDPAATSFSLKRADSADRQVVRSLFAEHLSSLGCTPDPELDVDMADFPAAYQGDGSVFLLILTPEGRPAGMGGIRNGEIRRLYIRPEARRQGAARALILKLLRAGVDNGQQSFRTVVSRTNTPARLLFQSCGFLPTGAAPEHPKMQDCEILLLTRPPDPQRPVAVVTGGSRGLGRHLVSHLASRYNVVFGWCQSGDAARDVAQEQSALGHWVWPLRSDVTDWHQVRFLSDMAGTVAGPCQCLIHTTGRFSLETIDQMSPVTWKEELETTVTGGFHAWRAFAGQLRSHARARLLFIGDSAAEQLRARRHSTAYYVGKHGLLLLARTIAHEHHQSGLTCNVVSPGVLPNSIDLDQPGMIPNVNFGEIAGVIDFLLGPSADAVSGSHLIASRGWNL